MNLGSPQAHPGEVTEVTHLLGGERVNGAKGISKGIHIGGKGSFQVGFGLTDFFRGSGVVEGQVCMGKAVAANFLTGPDHLFKLRDGYKVRGAVDPVGHNIEHAGESIGLHDGKGVLIHA